MDEDQREIPPYIQSHVTCSAKDCLLVAFIPKRPPTPPPHPSVLVVIEVGRCLLQGQMEEEDIRVCHTLSILGLYCETQWRCYHLNTTFWVEIAAVAKRAASHRGFAMLLTTHMDWPKTLLVGLAGV